MSELPTRIEVDAESGSIILSDLIRLDSVLSSFTFSLLQSIHNFTSEMQNTLDSGVQMVWMERIKKLSVVSKRLTGEWVTLVQVWKWFCVQNEENRAEDRWQSWSLRRPLFVNNWRVVRRQNALPSDVRSDKNVVVPHPSPPPHPTQRVWNRSGRFGPWVFTERKRVWSEGKKMAVERVVCLVNMCWVANGGLSLKSRQHVNFSKGCQSYWEVSRLLCFSNLR